LAEPRDEVAAFAAAELTKVLERASGTRLAVRPHPQPPQPRVLLRIAPGRAGRRLGPQAYRVEAADGGIVITGGDGPGVLYGVYAFLEALGVRFLAPGEEGTILPRLGGRLHLRLPLAGRPRFPERGLSEVLPTGVFPKPTTLEALDFMARLRLNRINLWFASLEGHLRDRPDFLLQARRRGIEIEAGGHEFETRLLPRAEFAGHPDWFRNVQSGVTGKRSDDHNCCAASVGARRAIEKNAADHARKFPDVRVFHFWPADIEGGWCRCPACKHLPPTDQAVLCMNAVARGVRRVRRDALAVFIGYKATDPPPRFVQPERNLIYLAAPLARCYAHPLDDPTCPRNRRFRAAIDGQAAVFRGRANAVFEYYSCGAVLHNLTPPLLDLIAADLGYYERAGIRQVKTLVFSYRRLAPLELVTLWGFARLAYEGGAAAATLRREYAQAAFGGDGSAFANLLRQWERIGRQALTHCTDEPGIAADTFWPTGSTAPTARRQERALAAARSGAAALRRSLARRVVPPHGRFAQARLAEWRAVLALAETELRILHDQVRGQNERIAFLADGRTRHLVEAVRRFRDGAAAARREMMRAGRNPLTDTEPYRNIQKVMGRELDFLAQWCEEERARVLDR